MNDEQDDLVVVIKARWARALGLDDETMSIVELEQATRRQRQAMEDAIAADMKHVDALRKARKEVDELRFRMEGLEK